MLKEGTVQVPEVMVPQVPHGNPQILFGRRAEDLRRGTLVLGVFGAEEDSAAPHAVLTATQGQPDRDGQSVEFDGGKIVYDCFARSGYRVSCRLCWHAVP